MSATALSEITVKGSNRHVRINRWNLEISWPWWRFWRPRKLTKRGQRVRSALLGYPAHRDIPKVVTFPLKWVQRAKNRDPWLIFSGKITLYVPARAQDPWDRHGRLRPHRIRYHNKQAAAALLVALTVTLGVPVVTVTVTEPRFWRALQRVKTNRQAYKHPGLQLRPHTLPHPHRRWWSGGLRRSSHGIDLRGARRRLPDHYYNNPRRRY